MKQSQLFTKVSKEAPKDEKSVNAQFLERAGFVDKLMAGVYSFLPLGLIVLGKIENIIREEMKKIGGQEVLLPALHPKEIWEKTLRWQTPEMFKLKSRQDKEYGLGWTHEEVITPLVQKFVNSYKDLPVFVFQIQDKFRDELRAKSGLLRGTEFIMKDFYSFHADEKDMDGYYETVKKAYFNVFKRCGLGENTFLTLASGGTFSKYSHEFQTVTQYGEDEIFLCPECRTAINKEIVQEHSLCPECGNKNLEHKTSIEVGNIFKLKDKYTKAFDFKFRDKDGKEKIVLMGCYGIGPSRVMGAIVEVSHDDKGIIWPKETAPFQVHLLSLGKQKESEKIYEDLSRLDRGSASGGQKQGIEVLYDDREDKTPGEKFAEADLIGVPLRIVVSERTLKEGSVEIKKRSEQEVKLVKIKSLNSYIRDEFVIR